MGDEARVYYDPQRHEDARISFGSAFSPNLKLLPVVGAIFLAGVALIFLSLFALAVWVMLS